MKAFENEQKFSPAAQLMAIEVISQLLVSTSPYELGVALTEHLRELTGARTVMVIAHHAETETDELLNVSPARRATLFSPLELNTFCPETSPEALPFYPEELTLNHPLRSQLLRAGIKSMARYPLRVGGELVGMLLLFDLPELERIGETDRIITLLAPPITLALKNSLAFRQIEQQSQKLEQRVEERTAELRKSEEHHRTILQTAMDGIWLVDTQGHFIEVNMTYCRMSGYSMAELLSMSISDIEIEESPEGTAAHIRLVRERGADRFESRQRRKDGTVFDVEVSAQYRSDENGQIVAFIQDITARKRAEEERTKLESQLLQAQKMESVGRLAGGVAHDFNNMLTVIIGRADLALMKLEPSQPLRADLEEIRTAARHSADLTRQLLAFARKQTIVPKNLDLNDAVASTLKMLQRLIGEDIQLSWQPAAKLWPVMADPSQIDQILANLCVNARDAISGVGKIIIETGNSSFDQFYTPQDPDFVPGEYVRLTVGDNGYGMDRETLAHIFEPFFTTKETGKGTGLGLATVYGAVKQNKGFINVYSEPGQGTTFNIYLPRHTVHGATLLEPAAAEAAMGHGEIVLLVEDEPTLLEMTREILEFNNYVVLPANSPFEALRIATEHPGVIHLLMTDVVMPGMNGRDLAEKIRPLRPEMKCLFMSGYTADIIAHNGVLDTGVHFIQKPYTLQALATKVHELLGSDAVHLTA